MDTISRRHHHHHMSVMELGHLLTRSVFTYLEVSSEVFHDSFCQLENCVSLSWVVCHEAFCLHVVSSSSCIPAVYVEPVLFLIPLQCVNLFCNLPKCILLFFSYVSSLLLLFSWHLVEVLKRRLQHLNYYMGWRSVGHFAYKGMALVLWVALCID